MQKNSHVPNTKEELQALKKNIHNSKIDPKITRGIEERKLYKNSLSCNHYKALRSRYLSWTEGGGKDTPSILGPSLANFEQS